jgi:hypothetical protein
LFNPLPAIALDVLHSAAAIHGTRRHDSSMRPARPRGVRDSANGNIEWALRLVAVMIAVGSFAVTTGTAMAAVPTRDGHYYGFQSNERVIGGGSTLGVSAELLVSHNARRLDAGSYVELSADCPASRNYARVVVRPGRSRARISRSGRFSVAGVTRRFRYRLRGRFLRAEYARITYTARSHGRSARPCDVPDYPVAAYLNGEPPFSGCRNQKATTLSSSPDGRVFEQYRLERGTFFPHAYACGYDTGTPPWPAVLLGRNYDDARVEQAHVRGSYVAYASLGCGISGCGGAIVEKSLLGGGIVRTAPAAFGTCCTSTLVGSLVLKPTYNASLAWITTTTDPGGPLPLHTDVYAFDSQGWRMLDTGLDIAPDSLRLDESSSTLSWVNGGVTKTDTLH